MKIKQSLDIKDNNKMSATQTGQKKTREYNWIEKEIDEIRDARYHATKHLTNEQQLEQSRKRSQELAKEYGLKIVSFI